MTEKTAETEKSAPSLGSRSRFAPLIAAIVVSAAMASYFFSPSPRDVRAPKVDASIPVVGEILSIDGEAVWRPPRQNGTQMFPLSMGPFTAETLVQTKAASNLVIEFRPGPTIRLKENSRLIAEVDPSVPNSIQATLLSGDIDIENPGSNSAFTLLKNGEALDYSKGQIARMVPLIELGSDSPGSTPGAGTQSTASDSKLDERIEENLRIEKETELASAPTIEIAPSPAEPSPSASGPTPQATAQQTKKTLEEPTEKFESKLLSTLTNDDIRTQLRAQAGGFQKCFVAMVNRRSESGEGMAALPRGQIRVAFKIKASGKVEDAKVLSSPFKDSTFDRCVGEALGRVLFRSFKGATIPVSEFPIVLE